MIFSHWNLKVCLAKPSRIISSNVKPLSLYDGILRKITQVCSKTLKPRVSTLQRRHFQALRTKAHQKIQWSSYPGSYSSIIYRVLRLIFPGTIQGSPRSPPSAAKQYDVITFFFIFSFFEYGAAPHWDILQTSRIDYKGCFELIRNMDFKIVLERTYKRRG